MARQARVDIIKVGTETEPNGFQGEIYPEGWGYPGRAYIARDFNELVEILRNVFEKKEE